MRRVLDFDVITETGDDDTTERAASEDDDVGGCSTSVAADSTDEPEPELEHEDSTLILIHTSDVDVITEAGDVEKRKRKAVEDGEGGVCSSPASAMLFDDLGFGLGHVGSSSIPFYDRDFDVICNTSESDDDTPLYLLGAGKSVEVPLVGHKMCKNVKNQRPPNKASRKKKTISCQLFSGDQMAETPENRLAADPTPSRLIPEFPDEISEQFISRVPLSSHQELARVSRSWRTFICSPSFFKIRSQLRATERFLCIHLWTPLNQSRWYLLFHDRNGIPSSLVVLPPTPIPTFRSPFTSLGHSLYVLVGSSNIVQIFDARLGTWTTVPRMGISHQSSVVAAIRDRVYVVGGCLHSSDSWAEAVDPESGEWFPVPSPPNLRVKRLCASVVYEGALMAITLGGGGFVFNPVGAQPWRDLEFEWDMEGYAMTVTSTRTWQVSGVIIRRDKYG